jgi:hypothetical protein
MMPMRRQAMQIVSTDKPIPLLLDESSLAALQKADAVSVRRFLKQTSDSLRKKGRSQGMSLFFFAEWYTSQRRLHKLPASPSV